MTFINPLNVNAQVINGSAGYGTKSKAEKEETKETETAAAATSEKSTVSADDVLNYLAQSAVSVTAASTKKVDPSQYVDEESAARIAGFMADFEDKVASGLQNFDKEFQGVNISDSAKMAVVLAGIDSQA